MKNYEEKYDGQLDLLRIAEKQLSETLSDSETESIIDRLYHGDDAEDIIDTYDLNLRVCDMCGHLMNKGYVTDDGGEHFCSDECLYKSYIEQMGGTEYEAVKQYQEDYQDGYIFYTEW